MPHTPPIANVQPLRPHDHTDAARVAISWLAERQRNGWRRDFEDLTEPWRPEGSDGSWDLDGNVEQGWSRIVRGDDGVTRSRSSIVPGRKAGRIGLFRRTQQMADDGRAWLEGLAGAPVRQLSRTISDPAGNLARGGEPADDAAPQASEPGAPDLPPEALTQAPETVLHRFHENGCDDSIPALGGLTPCQAISTAAGLERVKGLLREYEDNERRQSRLQGRPAVSHRFLSDTLGISP